MFTYLRNETTDTIESLPIQDYKFITRCVPDTNIPVSVSVVPRMAEEICTPAEFKFKERELSTTGMLALKFMPTWDTVDRYPHLRNTNLLVVPMMFVDPDNTTIH